MQFGSARTEAEQLFTRFGVAATTLRWSRGHHVYLQGDVAETVFYVLRGYVKLTATSRHGKEAVIGVLAPGRFFGHARLSGDRLQDSSATPLSESGVARTLLALADLDAKSGSRQLLSQIDQQTLAGIVRTSQPRISIRLSRLRHGGFLGKEAGLHVNVRIADASLPLETVKSANA